MATCIALLRGVNVGGKRMIAMADLRDMLESLGMGNVRSLLQSGNLVFESGRSPAQLEALLEKESLKRLALATTYFVRTADQWKAVVAKNPFTAEAKSDPGFLHVHVLKESAGAVQLKALEAAIKGRERAKLGTQHAYLMYPDGAGRSKLTTAILDRHLGMGTARNWNTTLKLEAMACEP